MWYELILYNPIVWIAGFWIFCLLYSYIYWYCKQHFYFEGSWKKLDKSINFRKKKVKENIMNVV